MAPRWRPTPLGGRPTEKVPPGNLAGGRSHWFPIAVFFARHEVPIFLVNSQEVANLRRYYQRHAKRDRIDTGVLVRCAT